VDKEIEKSKLTSFQISEDEHRKILNRIFRLDENGNPLQKKEI
jgi:hypothetical protein